MKTPLQIAIDRINATHIGGDEYAYYADETSSYYVVTKADLEVLGADCDYSEWCAGHGREATDEEVEELTGDTAALTYTINAIDSDSPPEWLDLCKSATPGPQDSGRCRWTVTIAARHADRLERRLDQDDSVVSYDEA